MFRREIEANKKKLEELLLENRTRCDTEPLFLISQIQDCLKGLISRFQSATMSLRQKVLSATVSPREEASVLLKRMEAKRETLSCLKDEEFPERTETLEALDGTIDRCRRTIQFVHPDEERAMTLLNQIGARIESLSDFLARLDSIKGPYQNRVLFLNELKELDERFDSLMANQRTDVSAIIEELVALRREIGVIKITVGQFENLIRGIVSSDNSLQRAVTISLPT